MIKEETNPVLTDLVQPDNDLKNILVAEEFPQFVFAIAEENWVRGYEQAFVDVDTGQKTFETFNDKQKKSCKLCEK